MIAAPETEREVLGMVLASPDTAPNVVANLSAGDFTGPHRDIFEAMAQLHMDRSPVDVLTLTEMLDKRGRLNVIGGPSKLSELMNVRGWATHLDSYCDILHAKSLRRRVADAGDAVATLALDESLTSGELVSSAEARIRSASKGSSITGATAIREGVNETMAYLEADRSLIPKVQTGIVPLDTYIQFAAGWQVIVLAASGMGKTAFALGNLAVQAATAGVWVLVGSQEMPAHGNGSVTERLISTVAAVPPHVMAGGLRSMSDSDAGRVHHAADVVGAWPVSIMTSCTVAALRLGAERMQAEHGPFGVVVLDYLQKTPVKLHRRDSSRTEEMEYLSGSMKAMALELGVLSVTLSQPDKASQQAGKLRGSSAKGAQAIEADADAIIIIDRKFKRTRQEQDKPHAEIVLDKWRHGEVAEWGPDEVRWNSQRMRFEEQGAVKWGQG